MGQVNLIRKLLAQGYSEYQLLDRLTAFNAERELPVPTNDDVNKLRKLVRHVQRGEVQEARGSEDDARAHHLEELRAVLVNAWAAFEEAQDGSLNKSAYLSVIRQTVEGMAKIDGSAAPKEIRIRIEQEQAAQMVGVILAVIQAPSLALTDEQRHLAKSLAEANLRQLEQREAKIIDVRKLAG